MKILKVVTEHSHPFKTLIEVLKEFIDETNIEFRMDTQDNLSEEYSEEIEEGEEMSEEYSEEVESDAEDDQDANNNDEANGQANKPDKNGLRIRAVDTTKTVLINLKLDASNFSTFVCRKKALNIGVNLCYLHKLIKAMDKEDNLELYIDHDDKNTLKINIDSEDKNKKTEFELKLLDINSKNMSIPNIDFDAAITMNSVEFHKLCREMGQIADYIEIQCSKNKIEFKCKGEFAQRRSEFKPGDSVHISHADDGERSVQIIQGIYELKNLTLFAKCAQLCDDIQIFMKNEYPLVIRYTVATLGKLYLCLSPINDEDDEIDSDEDDYYEDDGIKLLPGMQ